MVFWVGFGIWVGPERFELTFRGKYVEPQFQSRGGGSARPVCLVNLYAPFGLSLVVWALAFVFYAALRGWSLIF